MIDVNRIFRNQQLQAIAGEIPVRQCDCCGEDLMFNDKVFVDGKEFYCADCVEEFLGRFSHNMTEDDMLEPDYDSFAGGWDA